MARHRGWRGTALRSALCALRFPLSALRSPLSAFRSPLSAFRFPLSAPVWLSIALALGVCTLLFACILSLNFATGRPNGLRWQLDSPMIGGHGYSLWVLPCDQFTGGQIVIGRDLWIYSRYPPPGLTIPLSGTCP